MFNYHQPNLENMQNYLNQEQEKSSGGGPNWFSIPAGMSSIRILPPWDPTGRVALPVFMHPIEYQEEGSKYKKYNWTCVNKTFGKPCPICEGLSELASAGVDTSNWEANRRQYYFNAIVMHDPTYDGKQNGTAPGTHVLLKTPKTFYDWVVSQITNPMIGDITSVTNGIDIYVTKEGTGLGTTYNMTLSPNGRTPIPQEYLEKIKDLYNLDEIFSAGFEQKQIDGLVAHLKKSAGAMSNTVGNVVNQMAGYTQAPVSYGIPPQYGPATGYPSMNNPVAPTASPSPFQQNPTTGIPVAPSPFQQTGTPPWQQAAPTSPISPIAPPVSPIAPAPAPAMEAQNNSMPKCFGQYDPGSVNCVVCPVEMNCSKATNG